MDLQLGGKRAFISGSSSGLGAAIAVELAAEGAVVAVHGRDADRVERTAAEIRAGGGNSVTVVGDLTDDAQADALCAQALDRLGGIDILVNNAGAILRKDNPAWNALSPAEWLDSYNLNVVSAVRLALRFTPGMAERGWGRVINISSMAATQRSGRTADYGAAKSGLENFTVNLSKALGPDGITVNAISPGVIMTPAVEVWLKTIQQQQGWPDDPGHAERAYAREFVKAPVGRLGKAREIAVMTTVLASPLSGFVNGVMLPIDGGTRQ